MKKYCKETLHQTRPLDVVSSDIFGLITLKKGIKRIKLYVVSFIDLCTRVVAIKFTKKIKGRDIGKILRINWINRYEKPKKLFSDQGRQYVSAELKKILKEEGIEHFTTTAYNPEGNGASERVIQLIALGIRSWRNQSKNNLEEKIENTINFSYHKTIGCCSMEAMKGYTIIDGRVIKRLVDLDIINENVKRNQLKSNDEEKIVQLIGKTVYVKKFNPDRIDVMQEGPYVIVEVNKAHTAALIEMPNKRK